MSHQILVVDDQVSICQHIQAILENEGYEVEVAHGGEEALGTLETQQFDILLADLKMARMDGLELFKRARKMAPNISGIIMTAYGSISSAVESIKQGISDYLEKPFEPESLLLLIEKTLRERDVARTQGSEKRSESKIFLWKHYRQKSQDAAHLWPDREGFCHQCPGFYHRRNRGW